MLIRKLSPLLVGLVALLVAAPGQRARAGAVPQFTFGMNGASLSLYGQTSYTWGSSANPSTASAVLLSQSGTYLFRPTVTVTSVPSSGGSETAAGSSSSSTFLSGSSVSMGYGSGSPASTGFQETWYSWYDQSRSTSSGSTYYQQAPAPPSSTSGGSSGGGAYSGTGTSPRISMSPVYDQEHGLGGFTPPPPRYSNPDLPSSTPSFDRDLGWASDRDHGGCAVPEPSTLALLVVSAVALALRSARGRGLVKLLARRHRPAC